MVLQFEACLLIEDNFLHITKNLGLFCISLRHSVTNTNSSVFTCAVNKAETLLLFSKNEKVLKSEKKPQTDLPCEFKW